MFVCRDKKDFHTQFSRFLAGGLLFVFLFTATHCHRRGSETKLIQTRLILLFLQHVSLTRHRGLRGGFICTTSFTAVCLCLVSTKGVRDSDCFPSSAYDEGTVAMVDGLCSSQFPPLCFTAAETKLLFFPGKLIV